MNGYDQYKIIVADPIFAPPQDHIAQLAQALDQSKNPQVKTAWGDINLLDLLSLPEKIGGFSKAEMQTMITSLYAVTYADFARKKLPLPEDAAKMKAIHAVRVIVNNGLEEQVLAQLRQTPVATTATAKPGAAAPAATDNIPAARLLGDRTSQTVLRVKAELTDALGMGTPINLIVAPTQDYRAGPGEVYNIAYRIIDPAFAKKANITKYDVIPLFQAVKRIAETVGINPLQIKVADYNRHTEKDMDMHLLPIVAENPKFVAALKEDGEFQRLWAPIKGKLAQAAIGHPQSLGGRTAT